MSPIVDRVRGAHARVFGTIAVVAVVIGGGLGGDYIVSRDDGGSEPPIFDGTCLVSNRADWNAETSDFDWTDCDFNSSINVNVTNSGLTGRAWNCSDDIGDIARANGTGLPLKVTITYSVQANNSQASAGITSSCTGANDDGNVCNSSDEVDLIIDIQGDGRTTGGASDGMQIPNGANGTGACELVITGSVQCGPRAPAAHQDGVQHQDGNHLTWVNFEVGGHWDEPDNTATTCQGASGSMDITPLSSTVFPQNITVLGARIMTCNAGLTVGDPNASNPVTNITIDDTQVKGQDPFSLAAGQCAFQPSGDTCKYHPAANVTVNITDTFCDAYPYGNPQAWPNE